MRTAANLALFSAVVALSLAGLSRAQESFDDVADVVVVEIPVQVIRDGVPVRGLTAADFEVQDGRRRREIVGFETIDLAAPDAGATLPEYTPVSGRRHFLLLFDLALSRPASITRARRAAADLVEGTLHPTDLVAVGVYSRFGAQILLGFTADRFQIAAAIQTLGLPQLIDRAADPLGIVLSEPSAAVGSGMGGGGGGSSPGSPDGEIQQILASLQDESFQATERNVILALTGAMSELAAMIGAVQGSKHVVFLSEGFDSRVAFGAGVGSTGERYTQQQQAEAAMSGQYWAVNSDTRFGSTSTLNSLELMTQEFVRSGATIQAVDIGGIRAGGDVAPRRSADDGLFLMANQTGGEHYRNYNDLGQAMGRMLERTSVTYLLAIQPQDLPPDGRYRRLKVGLKRKLKGARVIHRPGYFAPKPFAEQSPNERRLVAAELLLSGREGGAVGAKVDAVLGEAGDGFRNVRLEVTIDKSTLTAGADGRHAPITVYAYALDATGEVRDYLAVDARLDLSAEGNGLRVWSDLQLPPGDYTIRTLVRHSATGEQGVRTTRLAVPAG